MACTAQMPRRRQRMRITTLLLFIALLAACRSAAGSLMAIDLGSEFLKVALIKPGRTPIAIVSNEMSKRKTPALVGFTPAGERLLGEEAASFAVRYPDTVFARARDLLAKPADDPSITAMLNDHSLPYQVVPHATRGLAGVRLKDGTVVSAEELVASTLSYARQIAEAQSGAPVLDAVIAVPAYYGQAARQALIDAAGLVGINVLGLINTHAAAALQFGIERDFANKTQNVVFYDQGSGGTVVALVRYSSYSAKEGGAAKAISQLEVRDVDWDAGLGSNQLDALLARHFAAVFAAKYGLALDDVTSNPRSMAKLKKQVRRTKEMLSANSAAPISVEEMHDGKDFQSSITREEFEQLAGGFFERAAEPLKRVLERSALKASDIEHVELLGGGTRVPRLQAALTEVLGGRGLDRHVDSDEAVVLGASLFAANLSTSFRLRKFGLADVATYGLSLKEEEVHREAPEPTVSAEPEPGAAAEDGEKAGGGKVRNLLPYQKRLPAKRVVHFSGLGPGPLRLSLAYNQSTPVPLPPGASSPHLGDITITGIDGVIKKYNSSGTVNLRFEAAHDGLLRLTKVEAVVDFVVNEEKRVPVKTAAGTAGGSEPNATANRDGGADAPSKADGSSEEPAEAAGQPGEGEAAAAAPDKGSDNATASGPEPTKYETIIVPRKKTTRVALEVATSWAVPPLAGEARRAALAQIAKWQADEAAKRAAAAAKNELEAYIIRLKEALETDETVLKVSTEAQREELHSSLNEAEDWLYMEGDGEPAAVFKSRLAELRKRGNPIETRAQEWDARPAAVAAARREAELRASAAGLWRDSKPWVTDEERQGVEDKIAAFLSWLDTKAAAQAVKAAHEEPAFTSLEVAAEFEKLEKAFNKVANKKKPKPPPEPPGGEPGDAGAGAGGEGEQPGKSQRGGASDGGKEHDADMSGHTEHDEL